MREHPIIFSTPMVQAILDASKTQTRRVIKPQPKGSLVRQEGNQFFAYLDKVASYIPIKCPYGQVGDRLWVREAWRIIGWWEGNPYRLEYRDGEIMDEPHDSIDYDEDKYSDYAYQCDNDCIKTGIQSREDGCFEFSEGQVIPTRWRPSIFMPQWASRITLEITEIRAERLQEITDKDAIAEGWDANNSAYSPLTWFEKLWDSINGKKYPWVNNDWVWVISFKVVK